MFRLLGLVLGAGVLVLGQTAVAKHQHADNGRTITVTATAHAQDTNAASNDDEWIDDDMNAGAVQAPPVWIGVRLTPVPEPLAAHIGHNGLMIGNIVTDSPADAAGLEQYDVVVSFNGQPIEQMQDLVNAIADNGTDKAAELVVIHAGVEKSVSITPVDRPDDLSVQFKYEEPEAPGAADVNQYFGHRIQRGPDGTWMMSPLGRLNGLPDDVLERLENLGQGQSWQAWIDNGQGPHNQPFSIHVDPGDDDTFGNVFFGDNADPDARVSFDITIVDNDQSVTIHRDADGKIDVERTDADGNKTHAMYDDMDQFRQEDPDTYKLYRQYSGFRMRHMVQVAPRANVLPDMQRDFQDKLDTQLDKMRQSVDEAMRKTQVARKRVESWNQSQNSGGSDHNKSVSLTYDSNAGYVFEVTEDGQKQTFKFKTVDEFKAAQPELYEQYKDMLDGIGSEESLYIGFRTAPLS